MESAVRMALLEQELRLCQVQLTGANRIKTELTDLHHKEQERVLTLVQELAHCERRAAKAEIAAEYFSELNVQMSAKMRRLAEPNDHILTLEKESQNAIHDAKLRNAVLELELRTVNQENEKLKAKLENAMDTVLALTLMRESTKQVKTSGIKQAYAAKAKDQHNTLIDLMDDCLTPTKKHAMEESTTLLNDSGDTDDGDDIVPTARPPQTLSQSNHSDFSNSSYIVRFKGVRDMRTHGAIVDAPKVNVV